MVRARLPGQQNVRFPQRALLVKMRVEQSAGGVGEAVRGLPGGLMLDRTLTLRLSRRRALQLLMAGAAAALVPLGSIAAAQSSSPAGNDAQPAPQPGNGSPSGGRFSPAPSPQPSPTPALAGNPSTTT